MNNIELRIVNYYKGSDAAAGGDEILIGRVKNYEYLDLYDNETIAITIQTQDIKSPTTKKLSFARSFKIPATEKNINLLAWSDILNDTMSDDLVPINLWNYAIDTELYCNDLYLFSGRLQLVNITKDREFEVSFILENFSFLTELKDLDFQSAYRAKPLSDQLVNRPILLPENWIWDSILFESSSKRRIFPLLSTASPVYPTYVNKSAASFITNTTASWAGSAKTDNYYWGFVDDGKTTSTGRPGFDTTNLSSGNTFNNSKGFNPFETVKPYYYVGDIVRRIFRYLEYKINGEIYEITNLQGTGDGTATPDLGPVYPNYNKPGITLPNIPFRIYLDSDLVSDWNDNTPKVLDHMIMISPENESYPNPVFEVEIDARVLDLLPGVTINNRLMSATRFPLNIGTNLGNWDKENGVLSILNTLIVSSTNVYNNVPVIYSVYMGGVRIYTEAKQFNIPALNNQTYLYNVNLVTEDNTYTNSLSNKQNIKNTLNNAGLLERYYHMFVLYENYILDFISAGLYKNTTYNKSFDLRRYLYPAMEGFDLADFLQEVFQLYNSKIDDPLFKSTIDNTVTETIIKKYDTYFSEGELIDLSPSVNYDSISIKAQLFKDITLKYGETSGLGDKLALSNPRKLPFGSYYNQYSSLEQYAQNSIKIEFKSGMPLYFTPGTTADQTISGSYWTVPSLYSQKDDGTVEYNNSYPICFAYNNKTQLYTSSLDPYIIDYKLFNTRITSSNSVAQRLPLVLPVLFTNTGSVSAHPLPIEYKDNLVFNSEYPSLTNPLFNYVLGYTGSFTTGYDLYYSTQYDDLPLKNILTCTSDISLIGLTTLKLYDTYILRLDGEFRYFILNKIENFNLNEPRLCKLTLIETEPIDLNKPVFYASSLNYTTSSVTQSLGNTGYVNVFISSSITNSRLDVLNQDNYYLNVNLTSDIGANLRVQVKDTSNFVNLTSSVSPELFNLYINNNTISII